MKSNRKKYTKEHIDFLISNVKGITELELLDRFNKKFNMNISRSSLGNLKSKNNLKSGIKGGQFSKGIIPANKGKKWNDYMSKDGQKNALKTTFKKGDTPINHRPIGSERTTNDGYIEVKTEEPNKWMLKHRLIWEQNNGKLKYRQKLMFLDGNSLNTGINNLALISDDEMLIINRNNLIYDDKELTKIGINIAKVISKVNKIKKVVE